MHLHTYECVNISLHLKVTVRIRYATVSPSSQQTQGTSRKLGEES